MNSSTLPPAFALLIDQRNPAADGALREALPHLEPHLQAAALEILIRRSHTPTLAAVVGDFGDYEDGLQRLITARAGELSDALRVAIESSSYDRRCGAIEVIVRGDVAQSTYLLADAVRSRCVETRERSAAALHLLTDRLLDRLDADPPADEIPELDTLANCLGEALATAVKGWEIHFQPKILQAALWLGDRVEPAILEKLAARQSKIGKTILDILAGTTDPRLAGFTLRALAIPELRSGAARAIDGSHDGDFLGAVLKESWTLADARIEQGCRRIRNGPWVGDAIKILSHLGKDAVACAVRFLTAIGGTPESKAALYRALIELGPEEVRRAAVWRMIHDRSDAATKVLTLLANRKGDDISRLATRESRRRRGIAAGPGRISPAPGAQGSEATHRAAFDRYWNQLDSLNPKQRATSGDYLRRDGPGLGVLLRAKLASIDPLDRSRALKMIASLAWQRQMEESIQRLAYDSDPIVRSLVTSMLVDLPGPTTIRLLRAATDDPDERVQANAIEALDRLDTDDRIRCTEQKLGSSNGRVRANAVKSLLRVELRQAGETLLDMLEDSSPAHRLSALWVTQRLNLEALIERIVLMSRQDPDERVRQRAKRTLDCFHGERAARPSSSEQPVDDETLQMARDES